MQCTSAATRNRFSTDMNVPKGDPPSPGTRAAKLILLALVTAACSVIGRESLAQGGLFLLDFAVNEGAAEDWNIIDPILADKECNFLGDTTVCTTFALKDLTGVDNDVTLEILGIPFTGNTTPYLPSPLQFDKIDVPAEAVGDYQYREPDTAGSSAPFRFSNINPGSYRVTVFEGRTTDGNGQFAKLWVGDADGSNEPGVPGEHEGKNTEDFAAGSSTLVLDIAEGDYLWYRHLEDNSGGISGIIVRPDTEEKLSYKVNGDELGSLALKGALGNKVLSEVGPVSGLAQYWFEGNLNGKVEDFQGLGTEGTDANPLVNQGGIPIATPQTWWSGSAALEVNGQALPKYPTELIGSRFENAGNADNYAVKLVGEIFIPENGEFVFRDGVDDFTMLAVDQDGDGELEEVDTIFDEDINQGADFGDVLILDTGAASVNAGGQPWNGYANFEGIASGGEWRKFEMWMSEAGGGDAGTLFLASADDPDIWDDTLNDALTQEQIDKFLISNDALRAEAATLVSADLVASPLHKAVLEYVVQVSADGNDQITLRDADGDLRRVLDVSDTTVRVQVDGEIANGSQFAIFGADEVSGLDTLELLFDDASKWDLSQLASGIIIFGAATLPGDCNGDGLVNATDLECVTSVDDRDIVLAALNTLPGDLNGNGDVSFGDFQVLSTNFGNAAKTKYTDGDIDLKGDGPQFADFQVLSTNFGKTPAAGATAASVPEPTTASLIAIAFGCLGLVRRRR